MKILYVGSKYDYGIPERGLSFEHYNFYDTLVGMGHDIEYFDFFTLFHEHGREGMSRMLRRRVEEFRPDLMFTFLFKDEFDPEVIRKITTDTRTVTFNWFADDHWRFESFSRHWAPCFKFVSTTDAGSLEKYHSLGFQNVLLTQWGANPRVYWKGNGMLRHRVSFIGQAYGNRPEVIETLRRNGIAVLTLGARWNIRPWHRALRKFRLMGEKRFEGIVSSSRVSQERIVEIFQTSLISLNLSDSSTPGTNQIKGRNFEIPACGGFQLSGYAERLEEFFVPDKEIVVYRTMDELIEKIRYYLVHGEERAAIADAGYARVMREHTYEERFTRLFKQMQLEA
jgi:spore maturation protein CgeB